MHTATGTCYSVLPFLYRAVPQQQRRSASTSRICSTSQLTEARAASAGDSPYAVEVQGLSHSYGEREVRVSSSLKQALGRSSF